MRSLYTECNKNEPPSFIQPNTVCLICVIIIVNYFDWSYIESKPQSAQQ